MKYITIILNQPYWNAYDRYGWDYGIEGFGISSKLVEKAEIEKKNLWVIYKEQKYQISPKKAKRMANLYRSTFVARDGTILMVIPRTAFKRVYYLEETIQIGNDLKVKLMQKYRERLGGE